MSPALGVPLTRLGSTEKAYPIDISWVAPRCKGGVGSVLFSSQTRNQIACGINSRYTGMYVPTGNRLSREELGLAGIIRPLWGQSRWGTVMTKLACRKP